MSKKVNIGKQNRLPDKQIDVKTLLQTNRQILQDFHKQIQTLQAEASKHDMSRQVKKVIQRRKQKNEELKPKAAYFQQESVSLTLKKNFNALNAQKLSLAQEYWQSSTIPAACVGFSMAFSQAFNKIYVYGGISCNNTLDSGLRNYFYEFDIYSKKWREIQSKSIYTPITRYGSTLTTYNKQLILFGGVSEYKSKLKDRCQYPEISIYDIPKNEWKMMEIFSSDIRPRKNHAACIYQSYYVVYGGQSTSEDILDEIIVVNLDSKKPRWKIYNVDGRVNHDLVYVPNINGGNKQYLYSFGGMKHKANNQQLETQLCSEILLFPIVFEDGHLTLRDTVIVSTNFTPRELCIFCRFDEGILIIGGLNEKKEVVRQCQYLSINNLNTKPIKIDLNWQQVRHFKGVTVGHEQILVFGGNSHIYLIQK